MKAILSNRWFLTLWVFIFQFCVERSVHSQTVLNYQGRVISGGTAFNGTGQFKFAIVSSDGATSYWKNDGTTSPDAPSTAVSLPVNKGLFSVQLGDSSITNMGTINCTVLANTGLKLRVWFNDGIKSWQQFSPDQDMFYRDLEFRAPSVIFTTGFFDAYGQVWQNSGYIDSLNGKLKIKGSSLWEIVDEKIYSGKFSVKMNIEISKGMGPGVDQNAVKKSFVISGDKMKCDIDLNLDVSNIISGPVNFFINFTDCTFQDNSMGIIGSPAPARRCSGIVSVLY